MKKQLNFRVKPQTKLISWCIKDLVVNVKIIKYLKDTIECLLVWIGKYF